MGRESSDIDLVLDDMTAREFSAYIDNKIAQMECGKDFAKCVVVDQNVE